MAEMVKLFVNGIEVEVEQGKNLVDAVGAVGIEIPHLCYHPALGADGNCRMCLVGIEDGRPPLVPACKTPAVEGMKVQLDTDQIKKIQHDVMEFELINHPIDCPICDQAGECSLQDYYMDYDGEKSRMREPQVKKGKKMDFGCGVVHDQERCILCARCVRFTRQITKTGELGIVNRTDYARVTTFPGRPLDNRYALNVVDLCPVGAMTSRDFRFKQRVWFLEKDPSICHGCSKGCNIFIDHNREKYKDDVIYRFRPRLNTQVNGYFICDEGRLSYTRENENRLDTAIVNNKEATPAEAVEAARQLMVKAEQVLMLVSPNNSLEQLFAVKQLAEVGGATLSGYSEGYIKKDDGDGYLIQDDKSANRSGLGILDIEYSKEQFTSALQEADLLICFDNDLGLSMSEADLQKVREEKKIVAIASQDSSISGMADVVIPVASFSEYNGSVINTDGILQTFSKAVTKNDDPVDTLSIVNQLGGRISDSTHAWNEMKKSITVLSDVDPEQIPAQGLPLTDSEAADVPA